MSAGTTHHDLVPGALFLTRADLDDAILLLGGSERQQGHSIGAEAFDNAGLENLMVSVEAAARHGGHHGGDRHPRRRHEGAARSC